MQSHDAGWGHQESWEKEKTKDGVSSHKGGELGTGGHEGRDGGTGGKAEGVGFLSSCVRESLTQAHSENGILGFSKS